MNDWWRALRDRSDHPKINFFIDFIQDLVFVAAVYLSVKLFVAFGSLVDRLPLSAGHSSTGADSYLPFDHVRVMTTILYAVGLLSILASAACTLIKVILMQIKGLKRND